MLSKVDEFESALVPATIDQIKVQLATLAASKMVKNVNSSEAGQLKVKYEQYIKYWGGFSDKYHGIPHSMLVDACENWVLKETFFPGVEDIPNMIAEQLTNRLSALRKLKALANYEKIDKPKKEDLTKQQRAELITRTKR